MIVGDLVIADHNMMRKDPAHCLMEAATDGFVRHLEFVPGLGAAGMQLRQSLLSEMKRSCGCISLEIGAGPIALDRIAPLRDLPLEFYFRKRYGFGQVDLDALPCRLDVADVHNARQRRRPEARDRAAAGVQRQIVFRPLVVPAGRHNPSVLLLEVALLRLGEGALVPRVALIDGVSQGVLLDEGF